MKAKSLYVRLTRPFRKLYHKEHTTLGRQRLTLLLFCYIPVLLMGIIANFLGITQPYASFFNYTHTLFLITAAVFLWLYWKGKIDIGVCLSAYTIIGQLLISIEMVYCSYRLTHYLYYAHHGKRCAAHYEYDGVNSSINEEKHDNTWCHHIRSIYSLFVLGS